MLRNITTAPKSKKHNHCTDQINYDCFFCMAPKTQKIFSQDLKVETKIPDMFI